MKSIFTFIIITFSFFTFGQETKKVTIKNKEKDTKEVFHVLVSNDTVKHGEYKLFRNDNLEIETTYSNGLIEGLWTKYNVYSGKKDEQGNYINGLREGEWKTFQQQGKIILSNGVYIHGKKEGKWIGYHENGKDIRSETYYKNGMKEGVYTQYDEKGTIIEKANFARGHYFGDWEFWYNGKYEKFTLNNMLPFYFNDKEIEKEELSILSIKNNDTIEIILDSPIRTTWDTKDYNIFLMNNIRYPESAIENGVQGKVYVLLTIDENSKAKDFKVIKGVPNCPECDREALRVFKLMPNNWKAAISEGKPISGSMILTISFKLAH